MSSQNTKIQAVPLSGTAALRATLETKIQVARLRSLHSPSAKQRSEEAANLARFEARLAEIDR